VDVINSSIWTFGTKLLKDAGIPSARGMIGKWYGKYKKEDLLEAIISAEKNQVVEPVSYIQKILDSKPIVKESKIGKNELNGPWIIRLEKYRENGFWPPFAGPSPGEPGCMVPPELLKGETI
jgi:hypothetical protein